jgi:uncharacterized membrane protein
MKLSLAKTFFILLIAGVVLLTLILVGNSGLPEPLPTLRIFLGIIFVLLVPGYALQMALFPHRADLDPLTRAAFSFGLSIAILPPMFLGLSTLGLGVQFWPVAVALTLFVLMCATVALVRRRRLPEDQKPGLNVSLDVKGWWASQDRVSRWVYSILVLALFTAGVSAILVSQEKPAEHYTEFYILDAKGLSEDYPREVTAGQPIDFNLGIANREGGLSQYKIVVVRGEEQALAAVGPISLADGGTWEGPVTFELAQAGNGQQVKFLLERVGSPWPYRTLMVWMNVHASGGAASGRSDFIPSIAAEWLSETKKPSRNWWS